jgi:hypothetical protein
MRDVVATTADAHRKCIEAYELGGARRAYPDPLKCSRASLQKGNSCGGMAARAANAQALRDDTQALGSNRRVSA